MPEDRVNRTTTAYHEAGHAIAALRVRRHVHQVIVSRKFPDCGITIYSQHGRNPFSIGEGSGNALAAWHHTLHSTQDDMMIALAGPLAESKLLGCQLRQLGNQSDLENCLSLADRLKGLSEFAAQYADIQPVDCEELLDKSRDRIRRWVGHARVWPLIEAVAHGLIRFGILDSEHLFYLVGAFRRSNNHPILLPG